MGAQDKEKFVEAGARSAALKPNPKPKPNPKS